MKRRRFIQATLLPVMAPWAGSLSAKDHGNRSISHGPERKRMVYPWVGSLTAKDDGYRGIWYANQPTHNQYVYKYSGGFATYPQQQLPIAIHSKQAQKTFFCYGGTVKGKQELLYMVSYYDHVNGLVPKPTIVQNKDTSDGHDNPVMAIDNGGYIWLFGNAHGTARPAYIFKSRKPHSVDEFVEVLETNFSYGQPHYLSGKGFFFLFTLYRRGGRSLYFSTSHDGYRWSSPQLLARISMGHYQISCGDGNRVGTMFNYHPYPVGLNARTNLYYLETNDEGRTWRNVKGDTVALPLTEVHNAALVHDYQAEKLLVYLKDLRYDDQGHPVLLYLTSKGWEPGPANGPRIWYTARWTGRTWDIRRFTTSDHNYDYGPLYIEPDGTWRIIAPTDPGPQPWGCGGEMVMWVSHEQGNTWKRWKQLTHHSRYNQTYAKRPINANPEFYALWADGDPLKPTESHLYFTDKLGSHVWRLPPHMKDDFQKPEIVG